MDMKEMLLRVEEASNEVWKNWELAKMAHAMYVGNMTELQRAGQISSLQLAKNLKELDDELQSEHDIFNSKLNEYEKMISAIGELIDED